MHLQSGRIHRQRWLEISSLGKIDWTSKDFSLVRLLLSTSSIKWQQSGIRDIFPPLTHSTSWQMQIWQWSTTVAEWRSTSMHYLNDLQRSSHFFLQTFEALLLPQSLVPGSGDPLEQAIAISRGMPNHVKGYFFNEGEELSNVPKKYEHLIWFSTPLNAAIKVFAKYEENHQSNGSGAAFRPRYQRA